ncbi:MBL fold metallo-hydrolase [Actinomadura miaoliensis]|uniref:MBL fold metallo-hydrolase n=1 Tax=Actinomadura miaoliensis TaxID=430685 RepID=A0ABP7W607_9ACTN
MNGLPLDAALTAAATVVLARDTYQGPDRTPADLVRNRRSWLLGLIAKSSALRAEARTLLPDDHPARLLLHPDTDVATAATRLAALSTTALERRARQLTERRNQLQQKLASTRRKLEYEQKDTARLRSELAVARQAAADAEQEITDLRARLTAQHNRLKDPRSLAAALLTALPQNADDTLRTSLHNLIAPPRATASIHSRDLRVTPLGGDDHIGGSCLLVESGDTRLLVDAGIRPGDTPEPPRDIATALQSRPEAVVVTHAHADHCGYVPALTARLPRLRVVATPESCRLMPVMWQDSLKVMRRRADIRISYGGSWQPLYDHTAVDDAVARLEELPFGAPRRIGDLTVELFPAGHILGAAGAVIRAGDRRVVVTGDISGFRQESVDGYRLPDSARGADLLVLESTCCAEKHDDRETRVTDLISTVTEVYGAGGRVLIPAFALGRAQELALLMRTRLPHVPVLVDGMAKDLTRTFESVTDLSIFGGNVAPAPRPPAFDRFTEGVVIATSGMLTAGPAVEWAARILPDPHSAVLLSGYQDEESGGRRLLDDARHGAPDHELPARHGTRSVPLRARVAQIRLSAHADRHGLLEIADETKPTQVMLVHGLPWKQNAFRQTLHVHGHTTTPTAPWAAL